MIIIRHICAPLESGDDFVEARKLLVEMRDHYPEERWQIYNRITGDQNLLVGDRLFSEDDPEAVAYHLFDPRRTKDKATDSWWQAWLERWGPLNVSVVKRELWRLVE